MARLQGKTAIVTGSSSGIGRAISLELARHGARVVCADISEQARAEIASETAVTTHDLIIKEGGTAEFYKVDVTKAEQQELLVSHAVEKFGRLDIMVNNAGIAVEAKGSQPIWNFDQSAFQKDFDVNVTGVFLGCKYASAQMIKQHPLPCGDRGWILNTASILGTVGSPGLAGYVASKHAVMGLTKVSAWDCAPHRVHVNALCPGYTDTAIISGVNQATRARIEALHPFRGLGRPEDIAKAALFLVSEDNSWITGIGMPIDGGYTAF